MAYSQSMQLVRGAAGCDGLELRAVNSRLSVVARAPRGGGEFNWVDGRPGGIF
jgi:hypothetical protein